VYHPYINIINIDDMIKALTEEFRAAPESDANCLGTGGRAGRVWIGEGCIFDFEAYEDL
jgi:hypothetical protein